MLRSLYSGGTGLRSHQTQMDVIGNNISNVNTTGYKSERANFQDVLYQTVKSGGSGRNPSQVGTGTTIAGITRDMGQGALQNTGRTLDLAIDGKGFFAVQDAKEGNDPNTFYTRDGIFHIDVEKDSNGDPTGPFRIRNQDGLILCGEDGSGNLEQIEIEYSETDNHTDISSINIDKNGNISGTYSNGDDLNFVSTNNVDQIQLSQFANQDGLEKVGQNLYDDTSASGTPTHSAPEGSATIASGYLEMSNVDLSKEFTNMVTTQRGYQANSRVITVSDSLLEELVNLKR